MGKYINVVPVYQSRVGLVQEGEVPLGYLVNLRENIDVWMLQLAFGLENVYGKGDVRRCLVSKDVASRIGTRVRQIVSAVAQARERYFCSDKETWELCPTICCYFGQGFWPARLL